MKSRTGPTFPASSPVCHIAPARLPHSFAVSKSPAMGQPRRGFFLRRLMSNEEAKAAFRAEYLAWKGTERGSTG
jgi:hypothetical protein